MRENTTIYSIKINKKPNFSETCINYKCMNCPAAKVK